MKRLFRSGMVQEILSRLLGFYLLLVLRTIRWTRINEAAVIEALSADQAVIGCFWHGRIATSMPATTVVARRATRTLISLSPDGEFVARAIARRGIPAIRGSSVKSTDKGKAKGAATAAREALAWLAGCGVLVITPDGPRGPAERMSVGTLRLAARSGAPVFLVGLAARPARRLKTWDRMTLPVPFGRGAVVWEGPLFAPAGLDDRALTALGDDWSARLSAADRRAETALG